MIPLRDKNPSPVFPYVNISIIVLNVLVFFYELYLGPFLQQFLFYYGIVPVRYFDPRIAQYFSFIDQLVPLFTSMFLHGGWLHLIGNMWTLYIFGDNVEGYLGHFRYFIFYILSGLIAALIHLITNAHSQVPTIGASGAIAGVMGAYFLLYPNARILSLVPIFFFITIIEIPAYVFLGFWFFILFFNGTFAIASGAPLFGGIAWWAHIGGFAGGYMLLKTVFGPQRIRRRDVKWPWFKKRF
ncbi:MAG: rhomboid family intramembrane serine protease [Deltaproteobacteria bacterium]|nr:MAG: rhomboid family intramembrane serine protease [Deltaproteobacteria bacterium]